MKISKQVIEQYMELCPLSAEKCDTFAEIEYKIQRAVSLGKHIYTVNGEKHILYYCNCFTVKDDKVTGMYKSKADYYEVFKKHKNTYDKKFGKVLV